MNGSAQPPPWQHGYPPAYSPAPRPPKKGGTRTKVAVAVAAVSLGVAGGALWAGLGTADSGPAVNRTAAADVRLEPTSSAGASPFMTPVGQDQTGVTPPDGTAGAFSGDTPGLFGESAGQPSCDAQTLLTNLQADPAKAGAWAEAVGIKPEELSGYVGTLSPVVLRSDTAVTSYGYENGTFVAYPAVLQAGTAVFINSYGEPRVKCFSGNPLGESPDTRAASYVGPTWGYFAPATVTYVTPARTVIKNYTIIDVDHGSSHGRPGKGGWPGEGGGHCKKHPESPKCGGGNGGGGNGGGGNGGGGNGGGGNGGGGNGGGGNGGGGNGGGGNGGGGNGGGGNGGGPTGPTQGELNAKAELAELKAAEANKQAGDARSKANTASSSAVAARAEADKIKGLHQFFLDKINNAPTTEEKLKWIGEGLRSGATEAAVNAAEQKAQETAGQAKNAESAARSAEGTATAANEQARKDREAATKGPDKAKEGEAKEGEAKEGEAKEGEAKEGQDAADKDAADKNALNKDGNNKDGNNKDGNNKDGNNKDGLEKQTLVPGQATDESKLASEKAIDPPTQPATPKTEVDTTKLPLHCRGFAGPEPGCGGTTAGPDKTAEAAKKAQAATDAAKKAQTAEAAKKAQAAAEAAKKAQAAAEAAKKAQVGSAQKQAGGTEGGAKVTKRAPVEQTAPQTLPENATRQAEKVEPEQDVVNEAPARDTTEQDAGEGEE